MDSYKNLNKVVILGFTSQTFFLAGHRNKKDTNAIDQTWIGLNLTTYEQTNNKIFNSSGFELIRPKNFMYKRVFRPPKGKTMHLS